MTLFVGDLKAILSTIPDNYKVLSRAKNAHLSDDDKPWQLGFADVVCKVKILSKSNAVMLIREDE